MIAFYENNIYSGKRNDIVLGEHQLKKLVYIMLCFAFILCISACSNANQSKTNNKEINKDNPLKIYTTAFAYESFTKQIGGKYVEVHSIYSPGADMHSYEPTQRDMINIAKSDLFVYSNNDLDPVAGKITQSMTNDKLKLPLANRLSDEDLLHADEHDHEEEHDSHSHESDYDPHIWLDPVLDQKMAEGIKEALIQRDPKHRSYYEKNYKQLNQDLKDIDQELKSITKNPKRDKVIISHDSLAYLSHRYHFKQQGVNGMNDDEPSQKEILALIKNIRNSKMPYVLYEQNISSKITDVIRKETDTKPLDFHNLSVLTKQEQEDSNVTYQSLMKHNIKSLNKALNE